MPIFHYRSRTAYATYSVMFALCMVLIANYFPLYAAERVFLVKDINTVSTDPSSDPLNFVVIGDVLYFIADDGIHGHELWRSDSTTAGTRLVADIRPGTSTSIPQQFANVNNTLYFVADDGVHGQELWRSDGTTAGTVLVKDILPGSRGSEPGAFTDVDGVLFFVADDGIHGHELWKTDGTNEGTVLVKDFWAGPNGPFNTQDPQLLCAVDGTLFLSVYGSSSGHELWKSNGTSEGTVLVKDINPKPSPEWETSSLPSWLTNINGLLYFVANDGQHGQELWRSDGTSDGTFLIKDIAPGSANSLPNALQTQTPHGFVAVDNMIYFTASDGSSGYELWRSDGTTNGTARVIDLEPGSGASSPIDLTVLGDQIVFKATTTTLGAALWTSDGSSENTRLVVDVNRFPNDDVAPYLAVANNTLFFNADEEVHGFELWQSDGTAEGTTIVDDLRAGTASAFPRWITSTSSFLFFAAADDVHGVELWGLRFNSSPTPSITTTSTVPPATSTSVITTPTETSTTIPGTASPLPEATTLPEYRRVFIPALRK